MAVIECSELYGVISERGQGGKQAAGGKAHQTLSSCGKAECDIWYSMT